MAKSILVIDDDESIVETLDLYLTEEGYNVRTALTGTDGLNQYVQEPSDVVILDIRLPDVDGFSVLEDVNLCIHAGEFICVVGPNGGGKTTLLKLILGLLKPKAGTVRVFGQLAEQGRQHIGYVPQHAQVDPQSEFTIEPGPRGAGGTFTVEHLARKLARITPGQKIAYVTDVGDTPATREMVAALARDADQLFIEAAFLERERERAAATHHLTACQAGELAALAQARRFTLFHFSPRYAGREAELRAEAQAAFGGIVA